MAKNIVLFVVFLLVFVMAVAMLLNRAVPSALFMAAAGGLIHPAIKFRAGWVKGVLIFILIFISVLFVPVA